MAYDGSGQVMCPLVDAKISIDDCSENREVDNSSVPEMYKQKPDWRGVCSECEFQAY